LIGVFDSSVFANALHQLAMGGRRQQQHRDQANSCSHIVSLFFNVRMRWYFTSRRPIVQIHPAIPV
jgi:hypothetical protein